jgi:hypothetical protein
VLEVAVVSAGGQPLDGIRYQVTLPDGSQRSGRTGADGWVRISYVSPGEATVQFPDYDEGEP